MRVSLLNIIEITLVSNEFDAVTMAKFENYLFSTV